MKTDVCLVLEGTYPYVLGGVSSWVHQLITKLPQFTFSLIVIVPSNEEEKEYKYDVPDNVLEIVEVSLYDHKLSTSKKHWSSKQKAVEKIKTIYKDILNYDYSAVEDMYANIVNPDKRILSLDELYNSRDMWDLLLEFYNRHAAKVGFVDYVWALRAMHQPLFSLFDVKIPEAKLYHTISSGYAGILAVIAHLKTKRPFFITEHGIYTNERRIEIEQARWLENKVESSQTPLLEDLTPAKRYWINFFDHLSRITYHFAEKIVTLNDRNRLIEIMGGAEPEKTSIVPNGIKLDKTLTANPHTRTQTARVGFVGRVVSIKDVKTFIRACHILHAKYPKVEFIILGPTDEEPDYFEECKTLVEVLHLEKVIFFEGRVNVKEYYPTLDLVVLTSISEAQPLVILEAGCYGIPCVSSDVGSCNELLNGRDIEDINLGASGLITPIFNPQATADAMEELITDPKRRKKMGQSAQKRVEMFYSEQQFLDAYIQLYSTMGDQ